MWIRDNWIGHVWQVFCDRKRCSECLQLSSPVSSKGEFAVEICRRLGFGNIFDICFTSLHGFICILYYF